MEVKKLEIKRNNDEQNLITKNEEINFEKENFTEKEHRLFLESFILFDKNFKEMTKYIQTKKYNEILLYSDKFISYLNKKFNKKEGISKLKIDKENINKYSNEELEEYINNKYSLFPKNTFKENLDNDFFLDDNKSLLGSNHHKKIFFIRKYPKHKTLLKNNLNSENEKIIEFKIPNLGNDKESRKKIINKLLNENCKEENYTKMEELEKMSKIIQIINKIENSIINNDDSLISKNKSFNCNYNIINNKINDLSDINLGKKRLFNSFVENEKKEKNIETLNNLNQLNNINYELNFQKEILENNNNPIVNNNIMNNILSSSQNNLFPQNKNTIPNLNDQYLFNQINPINYFSNANSNINNNLINQQLLSQSVFNLPFPMSYDNLNQSIIYERNNQNPFFDNLNLFSNQQNNLNLMNNYVNNCNNNQLYNLFPQSNQGLLNIQNGEINNNYFQNLSNINFQNNINIFKNQNYFNNNF